MTLGRQLAIAVSVIFLVALAGVEAIYLRSAQEHLQRELDSKAQDAATSIGLSLGALMKQADAALAQTIVNPAFDRGHYERIEYFSPSGETLVSRVLPAQAGDYPAWLVRLFPLSAPTAESLVSAGWRQLGRVRVTTHPRFAYEQLWHAARNTLFYLAVIYGAALIALRLFLRSVLRPLAAVERAALAISARNFVQVRPRPSTRELARVVDAMNILSGKVDEAIEAEARRAQRLQGEAFRDPVAGVLNARGFAARFESVYEGESEPFRGVLALVELAELAALNQALGSARCDALLRDLYRGIEEAAAADGGFAGRWSGAVAIVALQGVEPGEGRERLLGLQARAGVLLKEHGIDRFDRVHVGAVHASGATTALRALARDAEEALLEAREDADAVVVVRSAKDGEAAGAAVDPVEAVREALAARRLLLVGQEAHRMSDHRLLHVEILARLRDAEGREMTAAHFMPIVAAHGLVEALDRSVIEQALERLRPAHPPLSINVSAHSAGEPRFLQWLAARLSAERIKAARLVFEMAEHGVVRDEAAAAAFARAVRAAGAGFAIDNFGVHRDSLALLRRLKPAYIKLAGAHTARMLSDAGARFFAESLVRAARQLDIPVIAQRIENDETFQALGAIGFSGYQGNLIDRPRPWPR